MAYNTPHHPASLVCDGTKISYLSVVAATFCALFEFFQLLILLETGKSWKQNSYS